MSRIINAASPAEVAIKRAERKAKMIDYLGGECIECGSQDNLEFDHIDPKSVDFRIAPALAFNFDRLLEEVRKCQLLCNKCHWRKTRQDRGLNKLSHGTATMYSHHDCRCKDCKSAWATYIRKRRKLSR